jgi:hypothetical protein
MSTATLPGAFRLVERDVVVFDRSTETADPRFRHIKGDVAETSRGLLARWSVPDADSSPSHGYASWPRGEPTDWHVDPALEVGRLVERMHSLAEHPTLATYYPPADPIADEIAALPPTIAATLQAAHPELRPRPPAPTKFEPGTVRYPRGLAINPGLIGGYLARHVNDEDLDGAGPEGAEALWLIGLAGEATRNAFNLRMGHGLVVHRYPVPDEVNKRLKVSRPWESDYVVVLATSLRRGVTLVTVEHA